MKFIVFIHTKEYIMGLLALIQSLRDKSGFTDDEIELVVLYNPNNMTISDFSLLPDCKKKIFINHTELKKIHFPTSYMKHPHLKSLMNKLSIFDLPYTENCCYLDSDMLCLDRITDIITFPALTVAPNIGAQPLEMINNYLMFNSGFLIFKPSQDIFKELQTFAKTFTKMTDYGDQGVLNEFMYAKYPTMIHMLGINWNTAITLKEHRPDIYTEASKAGIKFLHFTINKPWRKHTAQGNLLMKIINGPNVYDDEIKLWWKYYKKAIDRQ